MIKNVMYKSLFEIYVMKIEVDLPHDKIADHVIRYCDDNKVGTTYDASGSNIEWYDTMPSKDKFENIVHNAASDYLNITGRVPFENKGGMWIAPWATVWHENRYHEMHVHPYSMLAGTYYPYADSESAAIKFMSPYFNSCQHDTIPVSSTEHVERPVTGTLLLWPAWLLHGVSQQGKCSKPRVAISFNIDYNYHNGVRT